MTQLSLRPPRGSDELPELVAVWRRSVTATHDFLQPDEIDFYAARMATEYLPAVELTVADANGAVVGFSGTTDGRLEMLFVDDGWRGRGVGALLLHEALRRHPALELDVNEENPQAVRFYERQGFVVTGRSELDGDGRSHPLLHLRRNAPA